MIKKLFILLLFFVASASLSLTLNSQKLFVTDDSSKIVITTPPTEPDITVPNNEPFVFSSLPGFDENIKTSVKTADARAEIIRQYLKRYDSPLAPHSELIVSLSDQYSFDYRWLVAIAQQESNLCKKIPDNSYNCWGWGIYPEPSNPSVMKITRFDNYEDALRRIAPQFTKIFLKGKHYKDPLEVMRTYTPPSDGSWANGVSAFFDDLE